MRPAIATVAGAILLVAPAFVFSGYHLFQLTTMASYAVAVLGLGLVTGTTGQISVLPGIPPLESCVNRRLEIGEIR